MAKLGSGHRQMQAVRKARQRKTDAFTKKLYKFLVVMCTYTVLIFKYIFIAFWWIIKQCFKLMYSMMLYIYHGIVYLVKKAAEKFRKKEENGEQ